MRKLWIKIILLAGLQALLVNCGQFDALSSKTTYNSILKDNRLYDATSTSPASTEKPLNLNLEVKTHKQCAAGEMDFLKLARLCNLGSVLLITVKDSRGETVVLKEVIDSSLTQDVLRDKIKAPLQGNMLGEQVDVFACIDANKNDSCADEEVKDLNQAADVLKPLAGLIDGNIHGLQEEHADKQGLCDSEHAKGIIQTLQAGLVLFHRHINFAKGEREEEARHYAAREVGEILKNLDGDSDDDDPVSDVITIALGEFDDLNCNQAGGRTNGCFAKGTKIKVAADLDVEIEKIKAGNKILLANGKYGRVKKVVAGLEKKPVITFKTENNLEITITSKHPMATETGIKLANQITIEDKLILANGNRVTLKSIEQKKYGDKVYNFSFEGSSHIANHLLIANGLVSGDLYLQNKMTSESEESGFLARLKTFLKK